MLFGMNKVGKQLHFAATCMVALGTFISAFWILSVNSWMHTPTGFTTNDVGQFVVAGSWIDVIFNPSFPYRLVHTGDRRLPHDGAGGRRRRRLALAEGPQGAEVRTMFSMAMWMLAIVAPIQIYAGDLHGLNTLEHQPGQDHGDGGTFRKPPRWRAVDPVRHPDHEAKTVH
jgi:cytochrome d ubiquinol oxidase subunit I